MWVAPEHIVIPNLEMDIEDSHSKLGVDLSTCHRDYRMSSKTMTIQIISCDSTSSGSTLICMQNPGA